LQKLLGRNVLLWKVFPVFDAALMAVGAKDTLAARGIVAVGSSPEIVVGVLENLELAFSVIALIKTRIKGRVAEDASGHW
jgi:hypothetical protein